jgi:hypothetical protein
VIKILRYILFFALLINIVWAQESEEPKKDQAKVNSQIPNRAKIDGINISVFGKNRVEGLVSYSFMLETKDYSTIDLITAANTKIRHFFVQELTNMARDPFVGISNEEVIKKRLLAVCDKVLGKGKVIAITLRVNSHRKF